MEKQVLGILVAMTMLLGIAIPLASAMAVPSVEPISVACVFATGGLGDKSFNDAAYAGLTKAKTDGLCTFVFSEPDEISDYPGMLESYATAGTYDLIVSIGFDQATALNTTSLAHPSQRFAIIDMVVFNPNVSSVVFNEHEGSFLVGAMAGLMTKTGKIGFVGGMDIPLIRKFWAGYSAGAQYENSSVVVTESFVGDWGDPATGKSQANSQITAGADIIFAAAGSSGLGALEACNLATGVYGIGVDSDQDYLYPGKILCSMLKRVDNAVYQQIQKVQLGTWTGASIFALGIKEEGVDISPLYYTHDKIPDMFEVEVQALKQKISDGAIVVPTNSTELAAFNLTRTTTLTPTTIPHPFTTTATKAPTVTPGLLAVTVASSLLSIPIIKKLRRK